MKKAAKAQWYAKNEGLVYGKVLIACPLNWRSEEKLGTEIVEAAVNSCFFPLYEVERGITNITYDPEKRNKRIPVADWLKMMGKTRHLLQARKRRAARRNRNGSRTALAAAEGDARTSAAVIGCAFESSRPSRWWGGGRATLCVAFHFRS